jgi:diaminopropionate ammonia-lyase
VSLAAPAGTTVISNPMAGPVEVWSPYTRSPLDFHRRLRGYRPTPLFSAPRLAQRFGFSQLLVKSENSRLGLMSFKMLGASWACYRAVAEHMGAEPGPWTTLEELAAALRPLRPLALAAATDGNHGHAVARVARWWGFEARIFVPEGTSPARTEAIAAEGATVTVVGGTYDDAVARAAQEAGPGCLVISDTSWPGYDQVPRWVIEGYSTMFFEIDDRLQAASRRSPDVVVVPVGVGALAAAAVNHWCRNQAAPLIVGVEPLDANCVMASAVAGQLVTVPGPHRSVMVGLNCGTPSAVAWPLVSAGLSALVAVDDELARQAVRELAAIAIQAGESGAAAMAGLLALHAQGKAQGTMLPSAATVLVVCTEGPTDAAEWQRSLGVETL